MHEAMPIGASHYQTPFFSLWDASLSEGEQAVIGLKTGKHVQAP